MRRPSSTSLKAMAPGSAQAGTIFLTWRITKFVIGPFGKPSRSPMPVTMTCLTGVRASTCWSVAQAFSKITIDGRAGVVQLVLEFARGVERVDVDDRAARRAARR